MKFIVEIVITVFGNFTLCFCFLRLYLLRFGFRLDGTAFTDNTFILQEFEKRRNCVLEELETIDEISCAGIPGTFYGFLNVSASGMSGKDFALALLRSKQVALIHGSAYGGDAYNDFVRIAFTMDCSKLRQAFARIREFLKENKK